jgi:hypothetical protein
MSDRKIDRIKWNIAPLTHTASGLPLSVFNRLKRLKTPVHIQNFLDSLAINHEHQVETYMSPLRSLKQKKAHCLEAALIACVSLWIHGKRPYLIDLKSITGDDHIIVPYKVGKYYGALSKTNHATLRFRDPVYLSIRELVLSYFHEYFDLKNGKKILCSYSVPFDMSLQGTVWITKKECMFDLADEIDMSPHIRIVSSKRLAEFRKADVFERKASKLVEWELVDGVPVRNGNLK